MEHRASILDSKLTPFVCVIFDRNESVVVEKSLFTQKFTLLVISKMEAFFEAHLGGFLVFRPFHKET